MLLNWMSQSNVDSDTKGSKISENCKILFELDLVPQGISNFWLGDEPFVSPHKALFWQNQPKLPKLHVSCNLLKKWLSTAALDVHWRRTVCWPCQSYLCLKFELLTLFEFGLESVWICVLAMFAAVDCCISSTQFKMQKVQACLMTVAYLAC